jgi:hypothetical protein
MRNNNNIIAARTLFEAHTVRKYKYETLPFSSISLTPSLLPLLDLIVSPAAPPFFIVQGTKLFQNLYTFVFGYIQT